MTAPTTLRRLTTTLAAALVATTAATAQHHVAYQELTPFGITPPPAFGEDLLLDPVDVAVTGWGSSVSWTYVADAGANRVLRWVINPVGTAVAPAEWGAFQFGPHGVAVNDIPNHDKNERVYATGVDAFGEPSVQVFDRWGNWQASFKGALNDHFIDPRGVAVGPEGNVFVVDMARRVVEEFDPVIMEISSDSIPINTYGGCTGMVPLDVSVDLMRRVHVVGHEFFPFPVGKQEVFEYGVSCPPVTEMSGPVLAGVDARPLDRNRIARQDGTVATALWTDTVLPFWGFTSGGIQTIPTDTAAAEDLGGLEEQRTWRIQATTVGGDRQQRCDLRTYVTDRADGEVHVLESKELSVPRPAGIVAWWDLDETSGGAADDTMDTANGAWSGSPQPVDGVVRRAMSFDGGTSGVSVSDTDLDVGLSDFSVEAWIRPATQAGTVTILDARDATGLGWHVVLVDGQLGLGIDDGADSDLTVSAVPLDDGLWHHVAAVVERGVGTRLYVDGSLVATGASGGVAGDLTSGAALEIGREGAAGATGLLGTLDEVSLYHAALTSGEVGSVENARCAGKHLPPLAPGGGGIFGTTGVAVSWKSFVKL